MKKSSVITAFIVMLTLSLTGFSEKQPAVVKKEKHKFSSPLQQWKYERFGMFVHWGVYSLPAGEWHGLASPGYYAEHLMRQFRIPLAVYKKEVVEKFDPVKFDAEKWVQILKNAGMGYMVITAKHHDGFAMYDSDVSDYNIVKATPFHRDPMAELRKACKKAGVLFGFYYSHAQDWADPNGVRNTWDYPGEPDRRNWWKKDTAYYSRIKKYYYGKAIPQLQELIKKYDPDIIWFDTRTWGPDDLNRAVIDSVLKLKPDLIINSRGAAHYKQSYASTNDKPVEFPKKKGLWEAIPTTNSSYGHFNWDHTYKSPAYFIQLLCKAASAGGNLLLNIGPKADGTIDIVDQGILGGIGEWMKTNRTAIKGTSASPLPTQSFGEITRKKDTLYCLINQWPKNGKLVVGGLTAKVEKAWLLTWPEKKDWPVKRVNKKDVEITLPQHIQERPVTVLALQCKNIVPDKSPQLLLDNIASNRLHVIDASLYGKKLKYAGGNWRSDFLKGWDNKSDSAWWKVRNNVPGLFDMYISYDALPVSDGNEYVVQIDGKVFPQTVIVGQHHDPLYAGRVQLSPGEHEVVVKAKKDFKRELFRLRAIYLRPVHLNRKKTK